MLVSVEMELGRAPYKHAIGRGSSWADVEDEGV